MPQQQALLLQSKQGPFVVETVDIPIPGPDDLLVKITATALNPVDWKIQAFGFILKTYPAVIGSDAAGVVEDVGESVTRFAKGDKVLFQGYYNNKNGTFQQYALVPAEITAKIPKNILFDEAASIPLGLATAVCGIYNPSNNNGAGFDPVWEEGGRNKYSGKPVLVLGGAGSVGQYVIQLVKLSGFFPVITTASPQNAPFLHSIGATHVIDRHLPLSELPVAVAQITTAPVELVYDAVGQADTQNAGYSILAPGGYIVIVQATLINEPSSGKHIVNVFGSVHPKANRAVGISLYSKLTQLLEDGDLKPNRVEVLPDGLAGIPDGLERIKLNAVSGVKLVARPQETK